MAQALTGIPCLLKIVGSLSSEQLRILEHHKTVFENCVNLTDEDVLQAYINADLIVFASIGEGFGMPVIEAQAMGRPLVTSALAPMSEIAGPGACLVDPFDPEDIRRGVLRLIHDRDYRESVVAQGLRNVQAYAPETVAASYAALYREISLDRQSCSK